jgi:hypothetical protein
MWNGIPVMSQGHERCGQQKRLHVLHGGSLFARATTSGKRRRANSRSARLYVARATSAKPNLSSLQRLQVVCGNTTPPWQGDPLRVPVASPLAGDPDRRVSGGATADVQRAFPKPLQSTPERPFMRTFAPDFYTC